MDKKLKEQILAMERKADEALEDANALFDLGRYNAAASRSYYAVFHILQAVLLTKGLSFSKHSGVISGFSRYFIKEGVFSADHAGKIKRLWKNREVGDYEYEKKISEPEAGRCIEDATFLIDNFKKYLKEKLA